MREITGDLFEVAKDGYDALCVTTNGYVKDLGNLTMGRGVAGEAAALWPDLPYVLGEVTRRKGHMVHVLEARDFAQKRKNADVPTPYLIAFPTKPAWAVVDYRRVPGWKSPARFDIIELSAVELVMAMHTFDLRRVLLPRPGVGLGGLPWDLVNQLLTRVFDYWQVTERIDIISKEP